MIVKPPVCGRERPPAPYSAVAFFLMVMSAVFLGVVGGTAYPGADVAPVSTAAQGAGLVDVRSVIPDAVVDLRYAASDNVLGEPVYPASARCLVHQSLAPALVIAAHELRREGRVLVFWDCYRPRSAQQRLWDLVPDPQWVAPPAAQATNHTAARSVDLTTRPIRASENDDMGSDFDAFGPSARLDAAGLSAQQRANRARLQAAVEAAGLSLNPREWWHVNAPDHAVRRPHLAVEL